MTGSGGPLAWRGTDVPRCWVIVVNAQKLTDAVTDPLAAPYVSSAAGWGAVWDGHIFRVAVDMQNLATTSECIIWTVAFTVGKWCSVGGGGGVNEDVVLRGCKRIEKGLLCQVGELEES